MPLRPSPIERVASYTMAGPLTLLDVDKATMHDVELQTSAALGFPAPVAGASFTLRLTQDATGNRAPVWDVTVDWTTGVAPILSSAPGAVDLLAFACLDGATWDGVFVAAGLA